MAGRRWSRLILGRQSVERAAVHVDDRWRKLSGGGGVVAMGFWL